MRYIAIDPGKDGGIACLDGDKIHKTATPRIGDEMDIHKFAKFMAKLTEGPHHIVMEHVQSIFGASAGSNFEFGRNNGQIEGILVALDAKFTKVRPKVWQKVMWEGVKVIKNPTGKKHKKTGKPLYKTDTKGTSLLAAKRLFPSVDMRKSERAKNPHDGIVDALLMAEYCKRTF